MTPERHAAIESEIAMMRAAQVAVYHMALKVDAHEFQIFAALMSAYADLCAAALAQGVDYVENADDAKAPPGKARYIGQKLHRLLGPWMARTDFREQLLKHFLDEGA
jgi:hypothetical protein